MRSFSQLWPTLKRLLAYGSPWRKPLGIAVLMMWVAAAAEVSGPLLISYFIDNMVAKNNLPLKNQLQANGLNAAHDWFRARSPGQGCHGWPLPMPLPQSQKQ